MKLLVVAAWEPELARLRQRSGATASSVRVPRARAGAGEDDGLELVVETLGVGLVEAALAMTRCIAEHHPSAVVLIGTCGAFVSSSSAFVSPTGAGLGEAVVAGARARLVDAAVTLGLGALPAPMPAEVAFDAAIHDALVAAGAKSVQIANTVGITTDDALAVRLASSASCDVEHLEAFAVARACAVAGIPCGAALGIANAVGARGRGEWLAHHDRASASAADLAFDAIDAIAGSLRTSTRAPSPARA